MSTIKTHDCAPVLSDATATGLWGCPVCGDLWQLGIPGLFGGWRRVTDPRRAEDLKTIWQHHLTWKEARS